ncbi:MAG: YdcF family protein [Pirellulales bacterium]
MYRFVADLVQPYPLLYLFALLALANLWRKRCESRRRLLLLTVPFAFLATLSLPAVAHLALGSLEWRYPPSLERPEVVDAIVVLAGGAYVPDATRPWAEVADDTLYRCMHAARLYHRGKPCLVVVSGGRVEPDDTGPTLAQVMHDSMRELGVAQSDLVLEDRSTTTFENAVESSKVLREHGCRRVILVTDATHLERSVRCFRKQGFECIPSGSQHRATEFKWRARDFLPNPYAARSIQVVCHEWLGMVWYWWKGRI